RSTLGCEYLGKRYEEGQSFKPSCTQLCTCVGGGVMCVPLCTEDLNTPNCQHPRLVNVPGRCCREWVCDGTENSNVLENTAGIKTCERFCVLNNSGSLRWARWLSG
ncbi:CCN family member 2-like, partial [Tachysurus ichikawai]